MRIIKDFKLDQIPLWAAILAVTTPEDYNMERIIIASNLDDLDKDENFIVVYGGHCCCYDFNDIEWDATTYTEMELCKLMQGWRETGGSLEKEVARLMINYLYQCE